MKNLIIIILIGISFQQSFAQIDSTQSDSSSSVVDERMTQDAVYNRPFIGSQYNSTVLGGYIEGNTNYTL